MFKVREVAERLNISVSKVYALIETGELPHYRFGGAIRVSGDQIAEFLEHAKHAKRSPDLPKGRPHRPTLRHLKL